MAGEIDLRGMTSSLAGHDLTSLADDELASTVLDVQAHLNAAYAYAAAAMAEFERRGRWAADGAHSAPAWAAARTGSRTRELRGQARAGNALRSLPSAAGPARAGRLSAAHLGVLGTAVRRHPDLAARDEGLLVGQACELDADAFGVVGRHWCDRAADTGPEPAPEPEPVSEFFLSNTLDGRWVGTCDLDARSGAILDAAIQSLVDRQLRAQRDGDPAVALTAAQLRAQALVDLAAQALRAEPGKPSVPDRYRVGVVVNPDEVDDLAEEACDASFYRVVLGADGEVLDVGRDTRRWPNGIRRAITVRDGGCTFPGCDRPPSWCDIHHCEHWESGGKTSIDNGALLCRHHHTFIHKKRWKVRVEQGRPVVYRDDGSPYVITRWQAA